MGVKAVFYNPSTKVLRPGWRIPLLLLWTIPILAGLGWLSKLIQLGESQPMFLPIKAATGLAYILSLLGVYALFARVVERRNPAELKVDRGALRHLALGFLMGGGVMLCLTAVLALAGCYRVASLNSAWFMLRALIFYLPQSFIEDFLFCLILYRLLREGLGRRAALIVAPLLFMAAHLGNRNESPIGLLEIFTGGCLMYYAFDRTGSFWTVWAMHFSWNFIMNGVLGLANSGQAIPGFIRPVVSGPAWLTGGATGPEASVLAVGFDLLLLLLLWKSKDRWLAPQRHPDSQPA